MSIIDKSSRKQQEWCISTRHLLEYVARKLNYHSAFVANMQLECYMGQSCNSFQLYDLYVLLMELRSEVTLRVKQDFDSVDIKYIDILNEVFKSYNEGYPPLYKKFIN